MKDALCSLNPVGQEQREPGQQPQVQDGQGPHWAEEAS